MIKVRLAKPVSPVIWLDTSFYRKLADIRLGIKLEDTTIRRLVAIRDVIREKTRQLKLICVEGGQKEEASAGRVRDEATRGELADLTCSARMDHPAGITQKQEYISMQAFLSKSNEIVLPWEDGFMDDPVQAAHDDVANSFRIIVHLPHSKEMYDQFLDDKRRSRATMETLREENLRASRTFSDQLVSEHQAPLQVVRERMRQLGYVFTSPPDFSFRLACTEEFNFFTYLSLTAWGAAGGATGNLKAWLEYTESPHYGAVPSHSISNRMYADILTGTEPVRDGDAVDIQLLSMAIPYVHYVLADRRMCHRIRTLGMDVEFGTKMFSLAETDRLIEELRGL